MSSVSHTSAGAAALWLAMALSGIGLASAHALDSGAPPAVPALPASKPAGVPASYVAPAEAPAAGEPYAIAPGHLVNPAAQGDRLVALCFDDGPFYDPKHPQRGTADLLRILEAYQVKASFFVIGRHVERFPELFKRIVADGHEICNHTYSHRPLNKLGDAQVVDEIQRGADAIRKYYQGPIRFFRPPQWAITAETRQLINQKFPAYTIMTAPIDHDVHDWGARCTVGSIYNNAVKLERLRNFVLVLHCDGPEIGNKRSLIKILDKFLGDGYRFVTLGEYADRGLLR